MELQGSFYRIISETEGIFRLSLDSDHFIYKAHFPKKPVTPGVCIVKIAVELLGRKLGRKIELKSVKNVKFTSVISPIETPCVTFTIMKIREEENSVSAQMEVSDDEKLFAKLSIVVG